MGLGHNPLINGLIPHTFKKTFSCWSQVTMLFKNFFLTKNCNQNFNWGPPRQAPHAKKKHVALENNWGYTLVEVWPRKRCNKYFTKTFFFKIPDLEQANLGTGRRRKFPLDGATDFLATIWQHIKTVSLGVSEKSYYHHLDTTFGMSYSRFGPCWTPLL